MSDSLYLACPPGVVKAGFNFPSARQRSIVFVDTPSAFATAPADSIIFRF